MSLTCGAGRPHLEAVDLWAPMLAPHCYVGSPPPPRLHLRHPLSQFDPRAHDGYLGLYKQPCTPLPGAILETLIHISDLDQDTPRGLGLELSNIVD